MMKGSLQHSMPSLCLSSMTHLMKSPMRWEALLGFENSSETYSAYQCSMATCEEHHVQPDMHQESWHWDTQH